jgi:large subunit ribosomal protein L30
MAVERTGKQLRITWVKSAIGYAENQKRTIRALGLRRLGQSVLKDDSPPIRGMVATVSHLIQVEEVQE